MRRSRLGLGLQLKVGKADGLRGRLCLGRWRRTQVEAGEAGGGRRGHLDGLGVVVHLEGGEARRLKEK